MMRTPDLRSERGVALVLAVFAMVVIGALVAGTVLVGRLEFQSSQAALHAAAAQEAAEAGLAERIDDWDVMLYNEMPFGADSAILGGIVEMGQSGSYVEYSDRVTRFNNTMFLIESTGRRLGAGGAVLAERTVAGFMRLARPTVSVNAAVTVTDPIQFNGNAFTVAGVNGNPPGWDDCDPVRGDNLDDLVGIRSSTGTGVTSSDLDNVSGSPVPYVDNDPSITSETFQAYLDYTYETLAAQDNVKELPLTTPYLFTPIVELTDATQCDRDFALNMGEPRRPPLLTVPPCYGYFPVVHGTGNRTKMASNSRGQGTLLIDGDLELQGGFEWNGIIIVRGSIQIAGTGNKIWGALLSESITEDNSIGGNVEITYSACAIAKAVQGASLPVPLRTRSWVSVVQ
jgi:hypothetical protein